MAERRYLVWAAAAFAFVAVYIVAHRQRESPPGNESAKHSAKAHGDDSPFTAKQPKQLAHRDRSLADPSEHYLPLTPTTARDGAIGRSNVPEKSPQGGDAADAELVGDYVDTSVIGRPFQLSESVGRTCAGRATGASDCTDLRDFLRAFAQESRDALWATATEKRIASFIVESKGDYANLRQVECRTDRCVVEVEARNSSVIIEFDKDPELKDLREGIGDLGFERSAGGQEIVVTLSTLSRRR
jgi:hypothetical protein